MSQAIPREPLTGHISRLPMQSHHVGGIPTAESGKCYRSFFFLEERASWMSHIPQHAADSPTPRPSLETVARGRGFPSLPFTLAPWQGGRCNASEVPTRTVGPPCPQPRCTFPSTLVT